MYWVEFDVSMPFKWMRGYETMICFKHLKTERRNSGIHLQGSSKGFLDKHMDQLEV